MTTVNGYEIIPGADLRGAYLSGADLHGADLYGADLHGADLCDADLRDADLHGADLRDANLHGANLHGADLCDANLRDADLHGADLRDANLCDANLRDADLRDADLRDANLHGANLRDANLHGACNVPEITCAQLSILPDEGEVIGWKKAKDAAGNAVIVKLRIPEGAKRSNATGRKCRADCAHVLEVIGADVAYSSYSPSFAYRAGEIVRPEHKFNDDRFTECASGVHFFITRAEAEAFGPIR